MSSETLPPPPPVERLIAAAVTARCEDPWVWRAHYASGAVLDEYDAHDAPTGRGFAEIAVHATRAHVPLVGIELVPLVASLTTQVLKLSPHARRGGYLPVFARRRPFIVELATGALLPQPVITILGLRQRRSGRGVYTFFFHDGSSAVSDDFNAV